MTPPPRELTKTGELEVVRELAADKLAAAAMEFSRTPPVVLCGESPMHRPGDSSETYEISERVTRRLRPEGWFECEKQGPAHRIWDRIDKLENERIREIEDYSNETRAMIDGISTTLSERRGAEKSLARTLAVFVGTASIVSVLATLFGLIMKLRGHG
jgi:hypothetical protein